MNFIALAAHVAAKLACPKGLRLVHQQAARHRQKPTRLSPTHNHARTLPIFLFAVAGAGEGALKAALALAASLGTSEPSEELPHLILGSLLLVTRGGTWLGTTG